MMNRILRLFLFSLVFFLTISPAFAQTSVPALETLEIEFWPDYDQQNVLVLLTGRLPAGTSLPAEVNIPLPADATLHVVARITSDGGMSDDVTYTNLGDSLQITLPDNRFRVEYYLPYSTTGSERSFSYTWLSDLAVAAAVVQVQQPVAATEMVTEPTAVTIATSETDGFVYHALAARPVPAGDPYTVSFRYTTTGSQLSIDGLPSLTPTPEAGAASSSLINNWSLLLGATAVLLIVVTATWIVATRRARTNRKPAKPRPVRSQSAQPPSQSSPNRVKGQTRFCHECGAPVNAGDQFCRQCGTAVKK